MPHYEHLMRVFLVPNSINTDRMIGLGFRCLGIGFQARDFSFACHVSDFAVQIPVSELLRIPDFEIEFQVRTSDPET